jgi:hypothetical protein
MKEAQVPSKRRRLMDEEAQVSFMRRSSTDEKAHVPTYP